MSFADDLWEELQAHDTNTPMRYANALDLLQRVTAAIADVQADIDEKMGYDPEAMDPRQQFDAMAETCARVEQVLTRCAEINATFHELNEQYVQLQYGIDAFAQVFRYPWNRPPMPNYGYSPEPMSDDDIPF